MKNIIFITLLIIFAQGCKDKNKEEQIIPSSKKSDCPYYITVKTSNGIDTTYQLCDVNYNYSINYDNTIDIYTLYPNSEFYSMGEYNTISLLANDLIVGEKLFGNCHIKFTYNGDYYTNNYYINDTYKHVEENNITLKEYLPNTYVKGSYFSNILDEGNNIVIVKGDFYIDVSTIYIKQ